MRIVCVGGGPAGLYASLLIKLRDPGHEVCVYERKKVDLTPGWGVTFSMELMDALSRNDPESARQIHASAFCWQEQALHIRGTRTVEHVGGTCNISRTRLLEILAARARDLGVLIEYGCDVLRATELGDADLIIAADGLNSRMRQAGDFQTSELSGRNKHIWLGADKAFKEFCYIFIHTDNGWLWAYAYAVNETQSTFIVECTPETWTAFGFDRISTDDTLPILERIFSDHLEGHRLIGTHGDGSKARWNNFKTIRNLYWHSGKIVLVGDSAHTANFTIGMGTTLAIEDAISLTDSLLEHSVLEEALTKYERKRQAEIARIIAEADCSARWFENIASYLEFAPHRMAELLWARRSVELARLPPRLAYVVHHTVLRLGLLKFVRSLGLAVTTSHSAKRTAQGDAIPTYDAFQQKVSQQK